MDLHLFGLLLAIVSGIVIAIVKTYSDSGDLWDSIVYVFKMILAFALVILPVAGVIIGLCLWIGALP